MAEPIEYDPEVHDLPAVLDVRKVALQEIDRVVGNELTLGQSETARLRGILFAAMSEAEAKENAMTRTTNTSAAALTDGQQHAIRTAQGHQGEYLATDAMRRAVAMSLVALGMFEHTAGLSMVDIFELTERGWDEATGGR